MTDIRQMIKKCLHMGDAPLYVYIFVDKLIVIQGKLIVNYFIDT